MIYIILPGCGIADMLFKLRVCSSIIGEQALTMLKPKKFDLRNNVDFTFLTNDLGFKIFNIRSIDEAELQSLDIYTIYDVFKGSLVLDESNDFYIDLNYPFWKHEDIMEYARKLPEQSLLLTKAFNIGKFSTYELSEASAGSVFVHYRLGDVALTPGVLIDKILKTNQFSDFVFLGNNPVPLDQLNEHLIKNPALSSRIVLPSVYSKLISKYHASGHKISLASDGYTTLSKKITNLLNTGADQSAIEETLLHGLFDFYGIDLKLLSSFAIGETADKLTSAFHFCISSEKWIRGASGFPFSYFIQSGVESRYVEFAKKSSIDESINFVNSYVD